MNLCRLVVAIIVYKLNQNKQKVQSRKFAYRSGAYVGIFMDINIVRYCDVWLSFCNWYMFFAHLSLGFIWYITPNQLHTSMLSIMQQEFVKGDFNVIGMCKSLCLYGYVDDFLRCRLTN